MCLLSVPHAEAKPSINLYCIYRNYRVCVCEGQHATSLFVADPLGDPFIDAEDSFATANEAALYAYAEIDDDIGLARRTRLDCGLMDPDGPQARELWRQVAASYGYDLTGDPLTDLSPRIEALDLAIAGDEDALGDYFNTAPGRTLTVPFAAILAGRVAWAADCGQLEAA